MVKVLNIKIHEVNSIDCFYRFWLTKFENKLYETNISSNRNITFTNVVFHKRKYMPDILFTDECNDGQNFGHRVSLPNIVSNKFCFYQFKTEL
jgi:hypothetical protein